MAIQLQFFLFALYSIKRLGLKRKAFANTSQVQQIFCIPQFQLTEAFLVTNF